MSGIQQRDPKKTIKRCEVSVCNEVATQQLLGVRNVGLYVFDVCAKHHREKYDPELEETYLRTFKSLGHFGVRELDNFFEKKLTSST